LTSSSLSSLNDSQVQDLAQQFGITNASSMNRSELEKQIQQQDSWEQKVQQYQSQSKTQQAGS
jgi:hypothetical protein